MLGRRLIWPNNRPAPYESGWSICGTVLAINRMRAAELAQLVSTGPQEKVDLRSGEGVDLEKLSALLNLKEERLRQSYMSSLGFSGARLPKDVSHCPQCLAAGYHSVFFEWDIVDSCPVHHRPLMKCHMCSFITHAGPKRLRRERKSSFAFKDEFIGDAYFSACKHILFDFAESAPNLEVDQGLIDEFVSLGQEMSCWLGQVKISRDIAQPIVAGFGYYRPGADLDYRSDMMRRVAGIMPIHTRLGERQREVKPKPASLMRWRQFGGIDTLRNDHRDDFGETELAPLLKSVYRQVFRRFVRAQHAHCWREFRKLDYFTAQNLSLERACLVCVAFATWAMAAKRICNVESFRKPHTANFGYRRGYLAEYNHPAAHTHVWFAQFLFILEELERARREERSIQIVQRGPVSLYQKRFLTQGETEGGITPFWILMPNIEHLQRSSDARCWGRASNQSTMLLSKNLAPFWDEYTSLEDWRPRGAMFYIGSEQPRAPLHTIEV